MQGGARKNGKYHDIRPRGSKLRWKTCAGRYFDGDFSPQHYSYHWSVRMRKINPASLHEWLLKEESGAAVSGKILLKGQDIAKMEPEELRRRVGLVFQAPSPFPFSIYKNMTYALRYYGVKDKKELDRQVKEKLQMAGLYDEVAQELDKSAHKLSGGQQQRLCIARALTVEPEILLLDEPCSALDVKSSSVIEKMLTQLKEKYTIVIVTHNIAQARRISDHVAFLFGGKLIEFAPAQQIFSQPKEEETKAFLEGIYG